ncbi:hypothetical protein BRE01_60610 [Brevibacillus reuszeri]|uniref:BclA C-terminal domain-containing protein n=1 Tax=Brevibacillus reuszeri TaxID=54915 RepID=A0ABQ0TX53_9BACL|nr:hypothetical protein [Brevibacillus reuszeri]MED1859845.1 hypothetical protein [Brevibacillus reuszeri]GED72359.1 hypothetical protein BRE01_60610 [Brevibacillus reuszeri]
MDRYASGEYQIDYQINYTNSLIGSMLAVAVNGVVSENASTPIMPSGSASGTALLNLNAGDVITLRNHFLAPLSLALAPVEGARMDITKKN